MEGARETYSDRACFGPLGIDLGERVGRRLPCLDILGCIDVLEAIPAQSKPL